MNYTNLTEDLVKKCLQAGADAAEVYLQTSRNLSIHIRKGEIESVQEASGHGAGIRVMVQGRMAFSHCNDLTEASLQNTLQHAVDFARYTTPDEHNVLPSEAGMTEVEGLYDPHIAEVSVEKKIEMALQLEALAMKDQRITKSSGASYGESENAVFLANSNGLNKHYKSSFCNLGVSVVAEKGEQKNTGGEYCSRRFFSDLISPEEIAIEAARKAYQLLDPRMVKTQKAAVIFDRDVARSLLGGLIGALNGESVLQGASFVRDKMLQKVAVDLLTITDDGTLARGLGSAPFDGEGVPTGRNVLLENGVVRSFIYNSAVASRAGTRSTGNAARGGFTAVPGIGTHNIRISPGKHSREEIIRNTQRGLLLTGVTGYGMNPVSGNFSGGANGLWIENGSIAFPVKGLTIAGSAEDLLFGIDMMGDAPDPNSTFSAPAIRIRSMQIGGK